MINGKDLERIWDNPRLRMHFAHTENLYNQRHNSEERKREYMEAMKDLKLMVECAKTGAIFAK